MKTYTLDLSFLCCLVIPVIIIFVVAAYGARSKLRYGRRIRDAWARGAFADMNLPENKKRVRHYLLLIFIGWFGIGLTVFMLLQPWIRLPVPFAAVVAVFIVFGIMPAAGGLLMQREINRRL